ncbi:glycosyltransferase family 2 protein [Alkalitalea saponilacus]|uniref:Dolichol-phosphate mannosyltransferase n=1 Tax=Alkalitalea saponilacus TaxID=889453 RepID=A0A1T5HN78_9BACT|nr:glycosyltransferase family 2 protein [Alkalitalea saponilacus]ASB49361.1 glycosyltransferase [Alkalitalea saponilacus]SKC22087.1 dolichol-phosphate mannosyltransferase [Alkalitalea saponilacus]
MISIVIPVYNEELILPKLLDRIKSSMQEMDQAYEIIFVDDGSRDRTLEILHEQRTAETRIKIIEFSRNFGHQAAITAGLEHASGEFIALMDSDLQDPPELLPLMYEKLKDGRFDVVNGFRDARKDDKRRRWMTKLFHRIFTEASGLSQIENTGHFSMINRQALDALLTMKEKTRYIPGLRSYIGFRQTSISYERQERASGESKMSLTDLFGLAADAVFSFSKFPLRACLWLGLTGVFIFLLAGIHVLVSKITGWAPLGWSSTMISIYFLGSIQLTFLGVLGEYIYRTYKESQDRPIYFIRKKYF